MAERWFQIPGEARGDRALAEQLQGLTPLLAEVRGRTVLDLGCAEGLISQACLDAGASRVLGVEIVRAHVGIARRLCAGRPAAFDCEDLDVYCAHALRDGTFGRYDVVLALAVLHKLARPATVAKFICAAALRLAVIRYPAASPHGVLCDKRSEYRRFDVRHFLQARGFRLERTERGPRDEVTDYFRRGPA